MTIESDAMRPMYLLMAVLCGTVLAAVGARADCADYRILDTLGTCPLAAGTHAIAWDGRDAAGCAMASGSYLVRLEHGGQVAVARMVLVR